MKLLVPHDPLNPRRADSQFKEQLIVARDCGWDTGLVDHDALLAAGSESAGVSTVRGEGPAVYRGWMLPSERYVAFESALAARGIELRVSSTAYRQAHELPGWCAAMSAFTPRSVWTNGPGIEELVAACAKVGGAVVLRDWCKSMKHHWDEAMFIPDAADAARVRAVGERFLELRHEAFTGGFVVRAFEQLVPSGEARTWWVDGRCVLVTPHPDTPDRLPDLVGFDPTTLADAVAEVASPFLTVDLVQHADGRWRVIEVGDGQVSDIPDGDHIGGLLQALAGSGGAQ